MFWAGTVLLSSEEVLIAIKVDKVAVVLTSSCFVLKKSMIDTFPSSGLPDVKQMLMSLDWR